MIVKAFSIYDSKAESFNNPIFVAAMGQATRIFYDQVNDEKSPFNAHPEDYTLFYIGEFDMDKGMFIPIETPKSMGLAVEFLAT